ncbi:MAG: hypothetical protein ACO3A2_11460, partial [Bdellovibrionia bacterium]
DGQPSLTQASRFNLYHLKIAAHAHTQVSIPAKALTGRAYEGHIFWDTEIFMLPFYLYTEPEIAKTLLRYRYQTLEGARIRARSLGYRGACYAWESTVSGLDVTPKSLSLNHSKTEVPIFTGEQQIHVTADVAYALSRYWDATLDHEFMMGCGAEILFETARFWVSRLTRCGELYHLKTVVGPDEYHFNVQDNAFTNWMARFNLAKAHEVFQWFFALAPDRLGELRKKIGLEWNEVNLWKTLLEKIFIPSPNERGVIEQFQGFFSLKPIQLQESERNRPPLQRLLNWRELNELQIVKQADVLMLFFLFPHQFSTEIMRANYLYYEPKTDHGSSLSLAVHAAVAARSGLKDQALQSWETCLYMDLMNHMANTELGIHAATLGGCWQALVFHLLGIQLTPQGIRIPTHHPPILPTGTSKIQLKLTYRGKLYPLSWKLTP